jgi:hypothetical protein
VARRAQNARELDRPGIGRADIQCRRDDHRMYQILQATHSSASSLRK